MAFTIIPNSDLDPGSPLSTDLMTKLRDNDDFLFTQTAGMVFVEKITPSTNPTTVTFSGLDGDVDEIYIIKGKAKLSAVGVGATGVNINVDPNAIVTNQGSLLVAGSGGFQAATRMVLAALGSVSNGQIFMCHFDAIFRASKLITSAAVDRTMNSTFSKINDGADIPVAGGLIASSWDEATVNITSLRLGISVSGGDIATNGFRDGSSFELYKLRQS